MLEQATNRNQNNKEEKRNKKQRKGNKVSNKSYKSSDNILDNGKGGEERREDDGESHGFICSSLGRQRKRPG